MIRAPDGEFAELLVPLSDRKRRVEELAEAMRLLADNSALRRRKGALAIEAAQKFDMATRVAQYTNLYDGES